MGKLPLAFDFEPVPPGTLTFEFILQLIAFQYCISSVIKSSQIYYLKQPDIN